MTEISEIQRIRECFKPKDVKILLVGESPPANGGFFYMGNYQITKYTQQAFERAINRNFDAYQDFLKFFKYLGCYLDDLSQAPINDMPPPQRTTALDGTIGSFAERLTNMKPKIIIVILIGIESYVRAALRLSKLSNSTPFYVTHFPGNGWQNIYMAELEDILREAIRDNIIEGVESYATL